MKLLKLVIVDDEPILLQGLLDTYDWADMGFKVVGSAQSGEQAIEVIKETKPHGGSLPDLHGADGAGGQV